MTVVIYGKDTCNWCDRAVELAHQYSLEVTYKSVDDRFSGEVHMQELKQLAEKHELTIKTVPQIWWNGKYIGGFDQFAEEIENTRAFGDGKL